MSYRVVGRPTAVLLITAISLSREIKEPGLDTSCQKHRQRSDEEGKRRKKKDEKCFSHRTTSSSSPMGRVHRPTLK